MKDKRVQMLMTFALIAVMAGISFADTDPAAVNAYAVDNFFLFITAVLVLFMQAGFAMVEAGLNNAKNTVSRGCVFRRFPGF